MTRADYLRAVAIGWVCGCATMLLAVCVAGIIK